MNIPSLQKIEAQARWHANRAPRGLSPEEADEMERLSAEHRALCRRIEQSRKDCPGGAQCTCATNPEVQRLAAQDTPIVRRIDERER